MQDTKQTALPTEPAARKAIPIYSGFMAYFPDAIAAVAELSRIGNDQHNPGKPLGWDRSKSGDEMDAMCRHMLDMASGTVEDTDGVLHATKQAWRAMAHLQKTIEAARWVPVPAVGAPTRSEPAMPVARMCLTCKFNTVQSDKPPCIHCWPHISLPSWTAKT